MRRPFHVRSPRAASGRWRSVAALALFAVGGCGQDPAGGGDAGDVAAATTDAAGDAVDDDAATEDATADAGAETDAAADAGSDAEPGTDAAITACSDDEGCGDATPRCHLLTGLCVACLQDADCGGGAVCLGNACGATIGCTSDKDCVSHGAVCGKSAGHCVDCLADSDCTAGAVCKQQHCVAKPPACTSSKDCAPFGGVCAKDIGHCVDCLDASDCKPEQHCKESTCLPDICKGGDVACTSPSALGTCSADGAAFEAKDCPADAACQDGVCMPKICTPGIKACDGPVVATCNARGVSLVDKTPCPSGESCKDGGCLPMLCTPGATQCAGAPGAASMETCAADGQSWLATPCKLAQGSDPGEACGVQGGAAACQPAACKPGGLLCQGSKPAVCAADGLGAKPAGDCATLPDGGPGGCVGGVCLPKACGAGDLGCAGPLVASCAAGQWQLQACKAGEACKAGACAPMTCVPGEAFCTLTVRQSCDASGTAASVIEDCAASGKTCKAGACVDKTCTPKSKACSADFAAVEVCDAAGLAVVATPCPAGQACNGGACANVVCVAGALSCAGNAVLQCDASGTAPQKVGECGGGESCKDGACAKQTCTPGASACEGDKLAVCDALGLGKDVADCPAGQICDGLGCKKVVCAAVKKGCDGNVAGLCNAKGTSWIGQQDCTASKTFCVEGVCLDKVCEAGSKACVGVSVGVCKADGLGYDSTACKDGDACTSDGCKDAACIYGPIKACDDGDPCTSDSCDKATGACATAPKAGPCDDGSACTAASACEGGACKPLVEGTVSTLSGSGTGGYLDGAAASARFAEPRDVVRRADGSFVVADRVNHRLRAVAADGTVSTLAGSGSASFSDGKGSSASFYQPEGLALQASGDVVVADSYNNRLRRVDVAGNVTTWAGNGTPAFQDGKGTGAMFYRPSDVDSAPGGGAVVADTYNHRVRAVAADGTVTTLAGTGSATFADGPAGAAAFYYPRGVAFATDGSVYVADTSNHRVRRIAGGVVVTVAGSGSGSSQDGQGGQAAFNAPARLAMHPAGVVVAEEGGHRLRLVTTTGVVTTLAGSTGGFVDGPASSAHFNAPNGLVVLPGGAVVIADVNNHRLRRYQPVSVLCHDGVPCTTDACDAKTGACAYAPIAAGKPCDDGDACVDATFCDVKGACSGKAKSCDDGDPCTTDSCHVVSGACANTVHVGACSDGDACSLGDACVAGKCTSGVGVVETIAGDGNNGWQDGEAAKARFGAVVAMARRADGSLAIAETHRVRLLSADGKTVSTLAGSGASGTALGFGPVSRFLTLRGLVGLADGSLYACDHARLLRIGKAGFTSLLAGSAMGAAEYVDGKAADARFKACYDIALQKDGGLVVADAGNQRVRLLSAAGVVTTLAGAGTSGYQDGPLSSAQFASPQGVAVGGDGAVYVGDTGNRRIRKIAGGQVTTVAGSGSAGSQNGAASSATFQSVQGLTLLADGSLAIRDAGAGMRRFAAAAGGSVETLLPWGTLADGGLHLAKGTPGASAVDANGRLVIGDYVRIRRLMFGADGCQDGSPCTVDACDKQKGCQHTPTPLGQACDDGDACTTATSCNGKGVCGGSVKDCDDGNSCTVDACHPYTAACGHDPALSGCDDGSACTVGEACSGGACSAWPQVLSTVAGHVTASGSLDGPALEARFTGVYALEADATGVFVADGLHTLRRIEGGKVTTVAGKTSVPGAVDGPAATALLHAPRGLCRAADGSLLIVDMGSSRLRALTAGVIKTLAGDGNGYVDGPAQVARFYGPGGCARDGSGRVWIADTSNQRIRRYLPAGVVETAAGGAAGFADGPGSSAMFKNPVAVAVDPGGKGVYVADAGNNRLRRVEPDGSVVTLAGNGATSSGSPYPGLASGILTNPRAVEVDGTGAVWIGLANGSGSILLRLEVDQLVPGFGIPGAIGAMDGIPGEAQVYAIQALRRGPDGSLWVGDQHAVRAVLAKGKSCDDGSPCTVDSCDAKTGACKNAAQPKGAACSDGTACSKGDACDDKGACKGAVVDCGDKNPCTADLCDPFSGGCSNPPILGGCDDGSVCTVGEACAEGKCQTGPGYVETLAGSDNGYLDGPAAGSKLTTPQGVAVRADGGVLFADTSNHRVRLLHGGQVTTVAGDGVAGFLDGKGTSARLHTPRGIGLRADGALVIFDGGNRRVRQLAADGDLTTLAGSGSAGAQDGFPTSASFGGSAEIAVHGDTVYLLDTDNHRLRTLAKDGTVGTAAGSTTGYLDGPALTARFYNPGGVAVDGKGQVFIADTFNHRIRRFAGSDVVTVAGSGSAGFADGVAAKAQLHYPRGLAVAADGALWIVDGSNRRVRRLESSAPAAALWAVSTLAGDGTSAYADGFGVAARFYAPALLAWAPGKGAVVGDGWRLRLLRAPSKHCADGDACTLDACDGKTGACSFAKTADGGACVDGAFCTVDKTCKAGVCQGGKAKACDDGIECSADGCDEASATCTHAVAKVPGCQGFRRVFVTAAVFDGNLGGADGADAKCAAAADAAKLGGVWKAWIAERDNTAKAPAVSFSKSALPYRLLDGAIIANDWQDLVDGSLLKPIDVTELGSKSVSTTTSACSGDSGSPNVWTNVDPSGLASSTQNAQYACGNFTTGTSSSSYRAVTGRAGATTSGWTAGCIAQRCSYNSHLYCFEQTDNFVKAP